MTEISELENQDNRELENQEIIVKSDMFNQKQIFPFKTPISLVFDLDTNLLNSLEIESNARNVEIYVNSDYKTTLKSLNSLLKSNDPIVIDGKVSMKFFVKDSKHLEISNILINGEAVQKFLKSSQVNTGNNLSEQNYENILDQLHLLELRMDLKLSKIQTLLENLLNKN